MGGARNQYVPCNWHNHLHYNLIIPSLSNVKQWTPKGFIGFVPNLKSMLTSQLSQSQCKEVCISVDGMKVLKHFDIMSDQIVGSERTCKSIDDVKNFGIHQIAEEMLYFSMTQ